MPHAWNARSASPSRLSAITSSLSSMSWRVFSYAAGQFVSAVADDAKGKQQTRAYSLASAANGNRFDLCVNRVEEGVLLQSPGRSARPAHWRQDQCAWAARALHFARADHGLDPGGHRDRGGADARLYAMAVSRRRSRPQQWQANLAGLWHPLRDRHVLPRGVRGAGPAQAQFPLSAHAEPRAG